MLFPSEQSALPASVGIFSGRHIVDGSSHTSVEAVVDDKLATLLSSEGRGVVPSVVKKNVVLLRVFFLLFFLCCWPFHS